VITLLSLGTATACAKAKEEPTASASPGASSAANANIAAGASIAAAAAAAEAPAASEVPVDASAVRPSKETVPSTEPSTVGVRKRRRVAPSSPGTSSVVAQPAPQAEPSPAPAAAAAPARAKHGTTPMSDDLPYGNSSGTGTPGLTKSALTDDDPWKR
jgi:hypothetical protein